MVDNLKDWMARGDHLPAALKDFHDQKEIFKLMHELQQPADGCESDPAHSLDYKTGQCYVIDRFLHFMARRGYTLQQSKKQLPFLDMQSELNAKRERDAAAFKSMISY